jgi:hypothetical protein
LGSADDRDLGGQQRQNVAIVNLEEVALEVGPAGLPQLARDGDVVGTVVIPPAVALRPRADPPLRVFALLPAGNVLPPNRPHAIESIFTAIQAAIGETLSAPGR